MKFYVSDKFFGGLPIYVRDLYVLYVAHPCYRCSTEFMFFVDNLFYLKLLKLSSGL